MDIRNEKLAKLLVNYSCSLAKGERILIDFEGECATPLVKQIIREVYEKGGQPFVSIQSTPVVREILMGATEEQLNTLNDCSLYQMQKMDAYIAIRAGANTAELSDVPGEQLNMLYRCTNPTLDYRVNKTKWVILRFPNNSMAQLANMSLDGFTDFFYDVCTLDYAKMSKAMDPLVELMNKTDKVHIVGPDTDLRFSIKGIPAIKCDGGRNIPDGEVYTAPVRDSMNGHITYNTPSEQQGFVYENVRFEVENGKIIKATSNDDEKINKLLDTDESARYFGEFALGVNPYIMEPMKDTLFDEKISGSFHLTPGMAYEDAPNGNKSALHWDLVNIQRPEYGGGKIYFDDVLVRKDGLFVLDELKGLNPENLK